MEKGRRREAWAVCFAPAGNRQGSASSPPLPRKAGCEFQEAGLGSSGPRSWPWGPSAGLARSPLEGKLAGSHGALQRCFLDRECYTIQNLSSLLETRLPWRGEVRNRGSNPHYGPCFDQYFQENYLVQQAKPLEKLILHDTTHIFLSCMHAC